MAKHEPLLIRADATDEMGTGHLMRCLALAQAWQEDEGQVYLVTRRQPAALENRLRGEGLQVYYSELESDRLIDDAQETIRFANAWAAKWVVVDGYHFDRPFYFSLKEAGLSKLCIDDYAHRSAYGPVDILLNQNIYADKALYAGRVEQQTKLLLGCRYVLLRREFWPWRAWSREKIHEPVRLLITLGGSDIHNVTGQILAALSKYVNHSLEIMVVLGSYNQNYENLQSTIRLMQHTVDLQQNVTDMPALMAWADVAITASGSTCWELAFMGLPSLMIITAENQQPIAEELDKVGVGYNLGWYNDLTDQKILTTLNRLLDDNGRHQRMSALGRKLVDGLGTQRVIESLHEVTDGKPMSSQLPQNK
jgi:UDP-2,4-diacetamido-2,4,6-trideoxy-beta-L-altropyranose hydrolase